MGDKEKYLNEAVEKLQQTSDCQVLKVSDFLVTAPYGGVEQDDFLNGALALKTLLPPQELLERLHLGECGIEVRIERAYYGEILAALVLGKDILKLGNLVETGESLHFREVGEVVAHHDTYLVVGGSALSVVVLSLVLARDIYLHLRDVPVLAFRSGEYGPEVFLEHRRRLYLTATLVCGVAVGKSTGL